MPGWLVFLVHSLWTFEFLVFTYQFFINEIAFTDKKNWTLMMVFSIVLSKKIVRGISNMILPRKGRRMVFLAFHNEIHVQFCMMQKLSYFLILFKNLLKCLEFVLKDHDALERIPMKLFLVSPVLKVGK